MRLEEDEGIMPIYRPRSWREEERRREKELKRTNWHQTKTNEVSAPLIIDPTAGEMTKEMKATCKGFEKVTGWRVAVVERAGQSMRSIAKAEPLKERGCQRAECFPCSTGGGNCERNGVGYKICWQGGGAQAGGGGQCPVETLSIGAWGREGGVLHESIGVIPIFNGKAGQRGSQDQKIQG